VIAGQGDKPMIIVTAQGEEKKYLGVQMLGIEHMAMDQYLLIPFLVG
jgi:hypothetical protein